MLLFRKFPDFSDKKLLKEYIKAIAHINYGHIDEFKKLANEKSLPKLDMKAVALEVC